MNLRFVRNLVFLFGSCVRGDYKGTVRIARFLGPASNRESRIRLGVLRDDDTVVDLTAAGFPPDLPALLASGDDALARMADSSVSASAVVVDRAAVPALRPCRPPGRTGTGQPSTPVVVTVTSPVPTPDPGRIEAPSRSS